MKFGNTAKTDTSIHIHTLPKLSQAEVVAMTKYITFEGNKFILHKIQTKGEPAPDGFTSYFHQTFKNQLNRIFYQLFLRHTA